MYACTNVGYVLLLTSLHLQQVTSIISTVSKLALVTELAVARLLEVVALLGAESLLLALDTSSIVLSRALSTSIVRAV